MGLVPSSVCLRGKPVPFPCLFPLPPYLADDAVADVPPADSVASPLLVTTVDPDWLPPPPPEFCGPEDSAPVVIVCEEADFSICLAPEGDDILVVDLDDEVVEVVDLDVEGDD